MKRTLLAISALILLVAGCARGVAVGSDSGTAYAVSVVNSTGAQMVVSYNDGTDHELGTVDAGRTQRFVVAGSKRSDVTITGRSATGTRTAGPYTVALTTGVTQKVTLR